MEANENILIINKKDLKDLFLNFLQEDKDRKAKENDFDFFKSRQIFKPEARKIVGVSGPTFDKLVSAGRFKEYTIGQKKYYLRDELLEALRTQSEAGKTKAYKPRVKPTIRSKKATAKV